MTAVGKAAVAAVLTASLLVVGGIGLLRTPDPEQELREAGGTTTASTFLQPAVSAGSLEDSIASLQERLRANPQDWRGFATLGLAYVTQARVTADPSYYPKAEGVLLEALRINDRDNVDAVLGLGALALARHDFEAALEHGRRAEALNPYSADAYGVIGDALLELGQFDKAIETFQTMVDTRPGLASYARVSYARELTGDVDGAVRAMRLAFAAAGTPADGAWAASQLGELAWGSGDVRQAAAWYGRGLDLAPGYVPNLAGLAKVAWARGDTQLAIERYAGAIERYPAAEYVIALGDLYATTGREDLAEQQYDVVGATRAIAEANGVNVDLEIALFDADHGDAEGALFSAEAEWGRRQSVHVADAYAWALYANDRYDEAARISKRALELGTRNAAFLFHAGMIELARGRDEAARSLLRRVIATNPDFSILYATTAERALAELEAER